MWEVRRRWGEMTNTLKQSEARQAARPMVGQVVIVLLGAGARGSQGSEVSSS